MTGPQEEHDLRLVVVDKRAASTDVAEITLARADRAELPPWGPGAHIDLVTGPGRVRQYSLTGDPADARQWVIGVLRERDGRGGSAWVHDELGVGDAVEVRGPRNHFRFEKADRYVFIAGGVGITPIRAMVRAAEEAGADWTLAYGGRTRSSMAYADELAALGPRVSIVPQDEHGLIDLDSALQAAHAGTAVYCCGPEPLLLAVEATCADLPGCTLHVERFAPKQITTAPTQDKFEVELARTGVTVTVGPDTSILDAATAAGAPTVSSCEEGICGTCETRILDGVAEHRDSVLTATEQENQAVMMICVSRAACPRLVLDL